MTENLPIRMVQKLYFHGDCWLWTGCKINGGYGTVRFNGKMRLCHRVSFELYFGPIPEGKQLDHICRNRACLNPFHLEPVSGKENVNRSPIHNSNRTYCRRGHPLAGANLSKVTGGVSCRICRNESARKSYHKQRAEHLLGRKSA